SGSHDRSEDVAQGVRIERDDVGVGGAELRERPLHLAGGNRAHAAEVLREDDVRLHALDQVAVQLVERLLLRHLAPDDVVDLPRGERPRLRDRAPGDDTLRRRLRREVTLLRDALEIVAQAERVDDLRRGGEQRDDLHRGSSASRSRSDSSTTRSVSARPASAPSSTRWSNVRESVHAGRASTAPSTTSARGAMTPSARIAAWPSWRSGVPASDP